MTPRSFKWRLITMICVHPARRNLVPSLTILLGALVGSTPVQADASRAAPQTYAEYCAACHGEQLEGGKGPALSSAARKPGSDDGKLARLIREGSVDAGMPAFGDVLNAAEIRALVVLIREAAWTADLSPPSSSSGPVLDTGLMAGDVQQTELHSFLVEDVVTGLDVPWAMAFLPDGRLLITERKGVLLLRDSDSGQVTSIGGIPKVATGDEAGLFDVAVDPDYVDTGWIYLSFSDPGSAGTMMTRIVRGRLRGDRWVQQQNIFAVPRKAYTTMRAGFGGRLSFDGPYLFFSVGDRHDPALAQDLSSAAGKVHRVLRDGSVPRDNPFAGTPGALASIWTLGHRNPQGLAHEPLTGLLWESEHGPRGGDELNLLKRGLNYGWPTITYGINYDGTPVSDKTAQEGLEQPLVYWVPSIAPSALMFYTGERFPQWQNSLFVGSLAGRQLLRMKVRAGAVEHVEPILSGLGRIRDIKTGPDGRIYLALEAPNRIVALHPVL